MARAVVVELDGQLGPVDPERGEHEPLVGCLDGRHRLAHPPEHDRAALVPLERDRDGPGARLQLDDPALERRTEHECGPEDGVPGERHLFLRVEDPHPRGAALLGREHEDGLGEADLERERLHRLAVEPARVREDRELVSRQRRLREDVRDDVAIGGHQRVIARARSSSHFGWCSRAQSSRTSPSVIPRSACRVVGWISPR